METYYPRTLSPVLQEAVSQFPAVVLTGPRQSGKTTLVKHLFGDAFTYVSLDTPEIRTAARVDPRGFLEIYRCPVILDEVQNVPDLLWYVKEMIDKDRDRVGQFILTGSSNLLLMEKVTQSLAGRAAILHLYPFSRREVERQPFKPPIWEGDLSSAPSTLTGESLWAFFLKGCYPETHAHPDRNIDLWRSSYIQTYLERDIRSLRNIGDITQFQLFLKALALNSGQLLNLTSLSRDIGIAVNTAKAWLSLLESTFQIIVLRPYIPNVRKRLVKTPKVYFTDTGILASLVDLQEVSHAALGPMRGAIMETAVVIEVVKTITHRGQRPQLYFYRTRSGEEVDLVLQRGDDLISFEVKASATPTPAMAASIKRFRRDQGREEGRGFVVHTGEKILPLGEGVTAIPYGLL